MYKPIGLINKRLLLIIIVSVCIRSSISAQQDPQYTQYMYNTATINPAYAGTRGVLSANLIYRAQWVGIDGAPKTAQFSINSPIGEKGVGLGVSFYNDQIGPSIENNFTVDYSYTIQVARRNTFLSFGLKGGFQSLNVDFNRLTIYDPSDIPLQNNVVNRFQPIFGVGAFLHTDSWYIGLSSPNILSTDHFNDLSISRVTERPHLFLIGGYVFKINRDWQFKPAFLARGVSGAPLSFDLSANLWYNERLTFGAAYRLDAAVSALVGIQATNQFMIGYTYDYDTTELGRYNNGSHEIFFRWEFITKKRNKVSPRFF